MRRFALAALIFAAAGPAAANDSVFTDLEVKACPVTDRAPPPAADDATPEAYAWRCRGHDGWNVFVAEDDLRTGIAFGKGRSFQNDYHFFPKFAVTGPKVEWRGPKRANRVQPIAAIVRFRWDVDGKRGSVLAVARLGRDDADTCVFAYVDAATNADANAIAARVADEKAADAACTGAAPQWVGSVGPDLR